MVDSYKSEPLEKRPSQNLGWGSYMKEVAIGLLPLATAAGAIAFGRLTKQRIGPLNGSPDIFTKGYEAVFKKGLHSSTGQKLVIDDLDRLPWLTALVEGKEAKLALTHDFWNGVKGLEVGTLPLFYRFWRHEEKKRIDLTSTYESLKSINSLKPTDDELRAENASLKQQLEYVRSGPATRIHADSAAKHGKIADATPERELGA